MQLMRYGGCRWLNAVALGAGLGFSLRGAELVLSYDARRASGQTRQSVQMGVEFR